jgi:2-keto-4-pentenoate hydratase/2-oxohepta-3-ene-1,7-dioic acid hydratase in catechol pathway
VVIRLPERRTDHEVELVVVIGKRASQVSRPEAMECVAGYAIGLDISIRGTEDRSFRKSPDSYSVVGPWLVTADEIPNPGALDLQIAVNGDVRQRSNTRHFILGVPELIEMASSMYTLHPGDLIFTGTPEGVSPIHAGDSIVATIERIGSMTVAVRADQPVAPPSMSVSSAGV